MNIKNNSQVCELNFWNTYNVCPLSQYQYFLSSIQKELSLIESSIINITDGSYKNLSILKKQSSTFNIYVPAFSRKSDITLVITSCGRIDLLSKTFDTFFEFNTYALNKVILIEDSGVLKSNDIYKRVVKNFVPHEYLNIIINEFNLGQLKSVEKAYSAVTTEYIFHTEDDWEYYDYHFVEKSKFVFKTYGEQDRLLQVILRNHQDIGEFAPFHWYEDAFFYSNLSYYKVHSSSDRWKGFSFNPGIRKTEYYLNNYSYSNIHSVDMHFEASVGVYYFKLGYEVISLESSGYVKHLGWNEHISQDSIQDYKLHTLRSYLVPESLQDYNCKLPRLMHMVWIFNGNQIFPERYQLFSAIKSFHEIKLENNLSGSVLWTNKPSLLISFLNENSLLEHFAATSISTLFNSKLYFPCSGLDDNPFYIRPCNNIFVHNILSQYGGVYTDLDYHLEYYIDSYRGKLYVPIDTLGINNYHLIVASNAHLYHKVCSTKILNLLYFVEELGIETTVGYFDRNNENYIQHVNFDNLPYIISDVFVYHETCNNICLIASQCDIDSNIVCATKTSLSLNELLDISLSNEITDYFCDNI